MSNQRTHGSSKGLRRLLSGVLGLALLLGLLPVSALPAQAASQSWAMPYMEQLVDWGVMRGDVGGNLAPNRSITRAEFVTLVNRAYGYTRMAGTPFTDVRSSDWYAQDIDIAYNMGYFKGTSPTTASPLSPVTREQAAVLLTRNLMLQETTGETLGFSDSRTLAEWSRGLIGAAAANGVISGYTDGSFRPQNNITRGEVAAMLVRSIGTPISEAGDYEMGAVYGNVTINTSGVNLRNSTITGNLYLTGGVDLGEVLLENVNVLGQIIVSGAGESNSSESSILMRNVEAEEMVVDSISNQFVTIRAEGNTNIGTTKVRTNAYVDDSSLPGFGLSLIELDGDDGALLQLAGNVKEVVNKTPNSNLQFVQGVADKVTVDEHAVGSNVLVDTGTRVGELNLDVATNVTGNGDIKDLNVGAAGSTVEIGPDKVEIRPGITSNVAGTDMTSSIAAEYSADPRLQAGYPKVKDVAPTSATAVFSTNKAGTIYWALSAVSDGSVGEDDLINPPVYGGKAVASGNLKAAASKTEYTVNLPKLTTDGSYYLSAILVDDRGNRSPLKVTAFTTPDSTTPAFASGYPKITKNSTETAQVTVMTNKDCVMYYALLPSGSAAPKAQDFKSAAISGNLGYGSVELVKNVTQPVNVNNVRLDEQTKYDLYLWLTDANGAKSSSVRKITFTTPDETPPVITYLEQDLSRTKANSIGMTYILNEPGRVYWVIYADDITNAYAAEFGRDTNETDEDGNKTWRGTEVQAKAFVKAGLNGIKKGTSSASRAEAEINFAISGLNSKNTGTSSYMLYVIAEDRAGNLADEVQWRNVRTLDTDPPTVRQEFTEVDPDTPTEPEPNTSIRLVFSESVQGDPSKSENFLELYNAGNKDELAKALANHIEMHYIDAKGKDNVPDPRTGMNEDTSTDWIVDYRNAQVYMDNGSMVVELPYSEDPGQSALNLKSGATYYFVLTGIRDQALSPNPMNKGTPLKLPEFRIMFAHVSVNKSESVSITEVDGTAVSPIEIDFRFTVEPDSVEAVEPSMMWDMLIWTDQTMDYDLYSRPLGSGDTNNDGIDDGADWVLEGHVKEIVGDEEGYTSFHRGIKTPRPATFPQLQSMKDIHGDREYAMKVTHVGSSDSDGINVKVCVIAGYYQGLSTAAGGLGKGTLSQLTNAINNEGVAIISRPEYRTLYKEIRDNNPPKFVDNYPVIQAGDISATIDVMIDHPGYVYWVALPLTTMTTSTAYDPSRPMKGQEGTITEYSNKAPPTALGLGKNWTSAATSGVIVDAAGSTNAPITATGRPQLSTIPEQGLTAQKNAISGLVENDKRYYLTAPDTATVVNLAKQGSTGDQRGGVTERLSANIAGRTISLTSLKPNTVYLVYMVTANTSNNYEVNPEVYRFTTEKAVRPAINPSISGVENVKLQITKTASADVDYMLVLRGREPDDFHKEFYNYVEGLTDLTAMLKDCYNYSGTLTAADLDSTGMLTTAAKAKITGSYTVLDAMETKVYAGADAHDGSMFDKYAAQSAKNSFASSIRMQASDGTVVVMTGRDSFTTANNNVNGRNMVKCTGMSGTNGYTFIAVGRSTQGSGDAFCAIHSVRLNDSTPPKVDLSGTILYVKKWDTTGDAPRIAEGTISVTFTEGLYAIVQDGTTPLPVCDCELGGGTGHDVKKHQALGGLIASEVGVTLQTSDTHSDTGAPIVNMTLDVADAGDGAGITFRPYLCDAGGLGRGGVVTIKIKITTDRAGNPQAELVVTPSSWVQR